MLVSVADHFSEAAQPPSAHQVLEMLGYEVVARGARSEATEKPAVEIESPPTIPLRVVASTIATPLESERELKDPWIKWSLEYRYGKKEIVDHESHVDVRVHLLILDSLMKEVYRGEALSVSMHFQEGQPFSSGSSHSYHLRESLKSGTGVWVALTRESDKSPWNLLSYQTIMLDRLEPISPK